MARYAAVSSAPAKLTTGSVDVAALRPPHCDWRTPTFQFLDEPRDASWFGSTKGAAGVVVGDDVDLGPKLPGDSGQAMRVLDRVIVPGDQGIFERDQPTRAAPVRRAGVEDLCEGIAVAIGDQSFTCCIGHRVER